MNCVVQKLFQEKLSALSIEFNFFLCIVLYHIYGIRCTTNQEGREEPADTTVLDTEMENSINNQENSKNDADSV